MFKEEMGYNKIIYTDLKLKRLNEGGFDSKVIYFVNLILALKYAHIARRSYFFIYNIK